MARDMSRRRLLAAGAAGLVTSVAVGVPGASAAVSDATAPATAPARRPRKALGWSMLPAALSMPDRLALAADLGFHGIEMDAAVEEAEADRMRRQAERVGVRFHSIMNSGSWKVPLSSNDASVVEKGLDLLRQALRRAVSLGADTVLQIPAVVTPEIRYKDAWERSQRELRKVLPLAGELNVVIAVENVGNRFLLSPLEFVRYVDEMNHPCLRAYFDVGNSLYLWGYPQDWIRTLGPRIRRIHFKDCDFDKKRFVLLRDGNVDWPAVRKAMDEVGYGGFVTVELNYRSPEVERGDRAYLAEISKRMDLILEGK